MTELRLSLAASPEQIIQVSSHLAATNRDSGASKLIWLPVVATGPALASILALLIGRDPVYAISVATLAIGGLMVAQQLGNRIVRRRYTAALATSAFRNRPSPATLSQSGLRLEAREFPWSEITALTRWNGMTLLHFSPVDAITVLDTDLPNGETPQTLAAQIAEWKTE